MSYRQRFYAELAVVVIFGLLAGWFASPGQTWPVSQEPKAHSLDTVMICDPAGRDCTGPSP